MSATYDKLKALLDSQKKLSTEDIEKAIAADGDMTEEERTKLEADRLEMEKSQKSSEAVTMDQYLEALKVLDTAAEGSDEYKKADELVTRYESGG